MKVPLKIYNHKTFPDPVLHDFFPPHNITWLVKGIITVGD